MKPAPVVKVRISVAPSRLETLLNALYESSMMHVEGVGDAEEFRRRGVEPASLPGLLSEVRRLKSDLLQIHFLREELKRRKFIKPGFRERMGAERREVVTIPGGVEEEMDFVRKSYREILKALSEPVGRIEEQMATISEISELLKQFEPLEYFPIPLKVLRGESTFDVKFLITREPEVVERFLRGLPVEYLSRPINVKKKKSDWIYAVYFLRRDHGILSPLLKRRLTVEFLPPREELLRTLDRYEMEGDDLSSALNMLRERLKKGEVFLRDISTVFERRWRERRRLFRATLEELGVLEEKLLGVGRSGRTKYLAFLWGWVEESCVEKLRRVVTQATHGEFAMDIKKPGEGEEPPVLLKNPKRIGDLQVLIEMYGLPKYNSVDPTFPTSLFFMLFIALMIGDAGYGLVIFLLSIIISRTLGKDNPRLGRYAHIGLMVGPLTIIAGIAMGTFFGDLIPRFFYSDPSQPLYSAELFGVHFPVDPMREPMKIFALSLVLGIIQMNIGFILGIYQRAVLQKNIKGAVTGYVSWFLIEIGGGALLGDFFIGLWDLTSTQFYLFLTFFFAGFALLFLESGIFAVFDLEGFVGDWISYARILALGLATSAMAGAINIMAGMFVVGDGVAGALLATLAAILLFFGHIINTGLQTLGAIVHSLRLQYAEFMGKFYESGGRPFKVFGRERLYTEVKEKKFIYKEV